jgi:uncharacterized membrane protein YeiB
VSAHPCACRPRLPALPVATGGGGRVSGVDIARGLALFGMMAAHEFDLVRDDGRLTVTGAVASGRSAVTFAVLAGVGLAFLSGGREVVRGRARAAASAGLAVRALLILLVGLLLGTLDTVEVILPAYALLFLLALPLLGLRPRVLLAIAGVLVAVVPILLVATAADGLQYGSMPDPTPVTLVTDPGGVLLQLLVTGAYPVLLYLAYTCVGLAVGRLDLGSRRVAGTLLGVGVALVVTAQAVSAVLLHPLGGLQRLTEADPWSGTLAAEPDQGSSWWYLALDSPHAHTQLDALNAVGSALAVLGAALLLTRLRAADRLLRPVAAAGSMTLTLYSAHILVLWTGIPDDEVAQYLLMVVGSMVFAVLWRRTHEHGPLEGLVTAASRRTRRAVLTRAGARRR